MGNAFPSQTNTDLMQQHIKNVWSGPTKRELVWKMSKQGSKNLGEEEHFQRSGQFESSVANKFIAVGWPTDDRRCKLSSPTVTEAIPGDSKSPVQISQMAFINSQRVHQCQFWVAVGPIQEGCQPETHKSVEQPPAHTYLCKWLFSPQRQLEKKRETQTFAS